jgi:hypothetical protein
MEYLAIVATRVPHGTPNGAIDNTRAMRRQGKVSGGRRATCSASDKRGCELANV